MHARRIQVHVLVSGVVQGVGFRAIAQREAKRRELLGWVRNLEDGRVEAVIQGPEPEVNAMVGWCRKGPLHASVSAVDVERQPIEAFHGFDLRP
ncbi:MAG: acylphosphatase [Myxococcales bacterium]|nr:acylphosphatase [Myxococcales bacterium]